MEVLRHGKNGKTKTVTLSAPMMKVEKNVVNSLSFSSDAAKQQLKIRNAWLGKN
jgi:hypothetical protein